MFRVMLDYMENELSDAFESLQYIYLGAEELTPELVKKYCDVTKNSRYTYKFIYQQKLQFVLHIFQFRI